MKGSLIHKIAVLTVLLFAAFSAVPTQAASYTITGSDLASIDTTFIVGPNGSLPGWQYSIALTQGATYPLMRFDLSSLSGNVAVGNGSITFTTNGIWPLNTLFADLELYALTQPYNPNTATWNNTIGSLGSLVDTQHPVFVNNGFSSANGAGQTVTFTIGQALLQSWMNSPGTNYGLALAYPSYSDFAGHSDISWDAPELTMNAVPEPQTIATLLTGVGLLGFTVRRRVQK